MNSSVQRTIVLVIAALLIWGCAATTPSLAPQGNPRELRAKLDQRIRENRDDRDALARLGVLLLKQKNNKSALRYLNRAAALAPSDLQIRQWQGKAYLAIGQVKQAMRVFDALLLAHPDWRTSYQKTIEPLILEAMMSRKDHKQRREYLQLIKDLDRAMIERHPVKGSLVYAMQGDFFFAGGHLKKAIGAFRKAQKLNSHNRTLSFAIGRSFAALGNWERADKHFDAFLASSKVGKKSEDAFLVGKALEKDFHFKRAAHYLERASKEAPKDTTILDKLGTIYLKDNQLKSAQEAFARLLEVTNSAEQHIRIARVYLRYRHLDPAIALWSKAVNLTPDDMGLWKVIARVLKTHKRLDSLTKVIAFEDRHLAWAEVYLDLRDFDKALGRYAKALKDGAPAETWLKVGVANHHLKKTKERDKNFATFLSSQSDKANAHQRIALAYEKLNAEKKALLHWRELSRLAPKQSRAPFRIANILLGQKDKLAAIQSLKDWTARQSTSGERVNAWSQVGLFFQGHNFHKNAYQAYQEGIALGPSKSYRTLLMSSAMLCIGPLKDFARAEEHFYKWIASAPPAQRFDANRTVASHIQGIRTLSALRNRILEDMVHDRPNQPDTYLILANAYLKAKPQLRDEALSAFQRYIELSDNRTRAVLAVGKRLHKESTPDHAAQIYRMVSADTVKDRALHLELGRLFLHVNDKNRARTHFDFYIKAMGPIKDDQLRTLFRLARTLNRRGLHDLAVSLYRRLLPREKNKSRVLSALGEALLANGQDKEADLIFARYIKVLKASRQSVRVAAEAFYSKGFYGRSRRYYERLFNAGSRHRLYRYFPRLVDVYMKLGDKSAILDLARQYTEITPSARAWSTSASYLRRAGFKKEALAFLEKASTLQPRSTKHLQSQVMLALELSKIDRAEKLLRKLIALRPGHSMSWIKAGRLLTSRGHDERAVTLFNEALDQGAKGGLIHVELGRIHLKSGRPDKAHVSFVEAINRAGELKTILAEIRKIYTTASQVKRYQDLLRRSIALYPNHKDALFELGQMDMLLGNRRRALQNFEHYASKDPGRALKVARHLRRSEDLSTAARFFERALSGPIQRDREKVLGEYIDVLAVLGHPDRITNAVQDFMAKSVAWNDENNRLANMLIRRGIFKPSIRLKKWQASVNDASGVYRQLGQIYLRSGKPQLAKRAFQKYIDFGAESSVGRVSRFRNRSAQRFKRIKTVASAYEEMGLFEEAYQLLSRANLESPRAGGLYVHRARLLLEQGKVIEGLGCIEEMIRQRAMENLPGPDLNGIYRLLVTLAKGKEGLQVFKKGAGVGNSPEFSLILIKLALNTRKVELAQDEADNVLSRTQLGALRVKVGHAFFEAGYFQQSVPYFMEALEPGRGKTRVKDAVRMLWMVAELTQSQNLTTEATARMEQLFEDRDALNQLMAEQLFKIGKLKRAAHHARQWLSSYSQSPTGSEFTHGTRPSPWQLLMKIYLRAGRYEDASEVAADHFSAAEDPERARAGLAHFLRKHMHYKKALPFFEQLLQSNKSDSLSQLAAGEIALLSGNDKAARKHFESYAAQHDARMYAQSQIAERYAAMGYASKAKALFEQSGTWKWSQTKTMILMALKQNDEGTVRRILKSGAATHSDPVTLMIRVAALYFRTHSFSSDLANDLARRIEKLKAGHPVVELIRACALAHQGKVGPAKQTLEKVLQGPGVYLMPLNGGLSRGPQYARAFALRTFAGFALRSANVELGKWALDKTLAGNPFGPAVAGTLQVIQSALERDSTQWADGDKRKLCRLGLAYLKRIRMHTEWRVWTISSESELYLKSGDLDAAINVFEAAIQDHPSNASYRNNLAYMLARQDKELPRALTMVRRAMQLQPEENLFYLDTEGWVLFKMGRYKEALKSLQHSVRYMTETSSSSISESLYHLALCYQKLGRTLDADNALRRAVKMDPEGYYGQKAFLELSSKTEN